MTKEKLAEKLMSEFAKDGEPITYDEALEMAEMELKAGKIKKYVQSDDKTVEKTAKNARKRNVSDEKKQIFNDLNKFLVENYDFIVLTPYKKVEIRLGVKTFTLDLVEQRPKK